MKIWVEIPDTNEHCDDWLGNRMKCIHWLKDSSIEYETDYSSLDNDKVFVSEEIATLIRLKFGYESNIS